MVVENTDHFYTERPSPHEEADENRGIDGMKVDRLYDDDNKGGSTHEPA